MVYAEWLHSCLCNWNAAWQDFMTWLVEHMSMAPLRFECCVLRHRVVEFLGLSTYGGVPVFDHPPG